MPKRKLDTWMMAEEGGGGGSNSNSNSRKNKVPNSLFVSFSKRRTGLFRTAAKLCHLFDGVQVAVLVLSSAGNPFAFGHSSVDNVLHRYHLRREAIPNTTYPLRITTAAAATTTTTLTDKHRYQARQVETLEARLKQAQNIQDCSALLRDLKAWIDNAWEVCKTVEELEFLKEKYLALLESVRSRLVLRGSFSFSPSYASYGEEKGVETKSAVVEPADNNVMDFPDKYMKITDTTSSQLLACGDYSFDVDHVFCDAGPLVATVSENDMSMKLIDEASYGDGIMVELLDSYDFDDQYLISSTGFDHGKADFDNFDGMEGNTTFFPGESSAVANVSCNVGPLVAIRPSNDMSFHSTEEFVYPIFDSYGEMGGVSCDQVFNYLDDQVPTLYLDGLETEIFDRKNSILSENN